MAEHSAREVSGGQGIVAALNREWARLDDEGRGTVASWAARHPVFARCCSLDDVLLVIGLDQDPAFHALLAEVARGDRSAGRVVLQAMLGRIVGMARRDAYSGVDDYVAALWCEIATYPLHRRPVRIAANLALDTLKAVQRERRWVVKGEVTTWPPGEWVDDLFDGALRRTGRPPATSRGEAVDVLDRARHLELIDAKAHDLLAAVYLDGLSGAELARRSQSTAGSVRVRCSRAVARLAASTDALKAAA